MDLKSNEFKDQLMMQCQYGNNEHITKGTKIYATNEITLTSNESAYNLNKHFAFNECETERNGIGIWLNEQEARELLLLPFEMAVTKGDAGAVMSSFNRAGCIWTGGDQNLSINILQKEWGFKGYSITDMGVSNGATYMVYDDAYMGGTNLFMGSANTLSDYKDNAAFCQKIKDSVHRILYTIVNKSNAINGISADTVIVAVTPWWEVTINALVITFGVLTFITLAGVVYCVVVNKKLI